MTDRMPVLRRKVKSTRWNATCQQLRQANRRVSEEEQFNPFDPLRGEGGRVG